MRKVAKILSFLLILAIMTALCGCYAAYEKTYLEITDVNGGGKRKIDCFFIKDGYVHPDSPAGGTHDNDNYFPKGVGEAISWLNSKIDTEIFSLTLSETEDGFYLVSLEFTFESLEDYNEKIALLNSYGGGYSSELSPALMTVIAENESYVALWQEDAEVAHKATAWMYEALLNEGKDAEVFEGNANYKDNATRADGNAQDTLVLSGDTLYSVTLGDSNAVFNVGEEVYITGKFSFDGSFKGNLAEKLPEKAVTSTPIDTSPILEKVLSGKDILWIIIVAAILVLMLAGFAVLYIRVRRNYMK